MHVNFLLSILQKVIIFAKTLLVIASNILIGLFILSITICDSDWSIFFKAVNSVVITQYGLAQT